MPDTILEEDHPRIISANFGWDWLCSFPIKIFLSETICSIRTKFWLNSHWMVLFQKCVWRFDPSIKFFFTCNLEVNLITHLDGSSDLLQHCRVGRSWHPEHFCSLNLTFISYSFWNKGRKVLKCWKSYEQREITPNRVMWFTSKLQGR
jgi:hypothetical protein